MDKNLHLGYTMGDIIDDMKRMQKIPTGVVQPKSKIKVKTINKQIRPMLVRKAR